MKKMTVKQRDDLRVKMDAARDAMWVLDRFGQHLSEKGRAVLYGKLIEAGDALRKAAGVR